MKKDNWIPTSDRLPEAWAYVLMFSAMKIELGFYNGETWHAVYHGLCLAPITHWQELPKHPE